MQVSIASTKFLIPEENKIFYATSNNTFIP